MCKKICWLVCLVLFFSSCTKDEIPNEYTIENQSGVNIRFKLYSQIKRTGDIENISYIDFPDGDKISIEVYARDFDYEQFFGWINSMTNKKDDSFNTVEVIYNNQRRKILIGQYQRETGECRNIFEEKAECDDRNLLNRTLYGSHKEYFVFTVSDYFQAEDCNGDCE